MTSFSRCKITDFRNLRDVDISPSTRFNLIIGENGSGKSSFLEALSVLSHGKSFRTHKFRSLISEGEKEFTLFAKVDLNDGRRDVSLGLQRNTKGDFEIRLAGERVPSASYLASNIPYLILDASSFALVEGGPKQRREFFDWLVFHVKHDFARSWREVVRCFKQRNILLRRERLNYKDLVPWDRQIAELSLTLENMRNELFVALCDEVKTVIDDLREDGRFLKDISVGYRSGWKDESGYSEQLEANFERDRRNGYSTMGPHKADLIFKHQNQALSDVLSRGQIKLFITALYVAKARIVNRLSEKTLVFAVDDLPSELDNQNQTIFARWLDQLQQQVFITAINQNFVDHFFAHIERDQLKVFHVKHGELSLV